MSIRALTTRIQSLLTWSERYFKTDMHYLARGGFWLVAGQAGAAVVAFAFSLLVARYVPPHIYGSYKYVLSMVAIIGAFSLTGLGTTLVRSAAKGFDRALTESMRTSFITSIPMLVGFAGVAGYYFYKGDTTLGWSLAIAGVATLFLNGATLFNAFWSGKKQFGRYTFFWTISNVFITCATACAVLLTSNVTMLVATYFLSSLCINGLLAFITVRSIAHDTPATPKEDTKDAFHLSIMNFLNTVSSNIDKIIIFQLLGTVQLAIYTFALALPDQMRNTLKAGARLAFPKFTERTLGELRTTLPEKMIRFGAVIAFIGLAYAVAAPWLFAFFFPAYTASIPYSQFFALTLFGVLGTAPLTALQAHLKHKELYTHAILTNVIQIGSSVVLIGLYGLWGATASLLLNRTIALILPWFLLHRTTDA